MKICFTILNPSQEIFFAVASACLEINRSREAAGLHGRVVPHTFSRLRATVLAVSWKQSKLSGFSQEVLDGEDDPESLIGIIERTLGDSLKFESGRRLVSGEAERVRAKCDPDPAPELLELFPQAAKSNLVFHGEANGSSAAWKGILELLEKAQECAPQNDDSWLCSRPQMRSPMVVHLPGFLPELTFSVEGLGESYLLMRPVLPDAEKMFEYNFDTYGCYRLLKLEGKTVKEVPLLWVPHCTCGHAISFDCADGWFDFEFHKGEAPHGFRRGEGEPNRLAVTLSGC